MLFAPLDVILADTTVVEPDLVYLDKATRSRVSRRGSRALRYYVADDLWP